MLVRIIARFIFGSGAAEQFLCLSAPPLVLEETSEISQAPHDSGMTWSKALFVDFEGTTVKRFRLGQTLGALEQHGKVV